MTTTAQHPVEVSSYTEACKLMHEVENVLGPGVGFVLPETHHPARRLRTTLQAAVGIYSFAYPRDDEAHDEPMPELRQRAARCVRSLAYALKTHTDADASDKCLAVAFKKAVVRMECKLQV